MKVLHINTTDTIGGAAIAAFRLHTAMLKNGIDSTYFVLCRTVNDRSDIRTVSKYDRHVKRNIHRILEKIAAKGFNPQRGFYSTFCFGVDVSRYAEFRESDIIYLHWVCRSFINWRILK
jgi:hypothetical protein